MIKRLALLLIVCIFFTPFLYQSIAFADTRIMMEADESISPFPTLSEAAITARPPLRNSNGTDNEGLINAQYNQPRGPEWRTHPGVDFESKILVNGVWVGRDNYSVYGNGEVWRIRNTLSDGYGRFVCVQHRHSENNKDYYFQSFYAHLASISVSQGNLIGSNTKIGQSGGSGTKEDSHPIHTHLEFRRPTSTSGTLGSQMYPPSFFYWRRGGNWGNNTSFINRTSVSGNTVQFRIIDMAVGGVTRDVNNSRVVIKYKRSVDSTWLGTWGNMSKNGAIFSFTFSGYTPGTVIDYYVVAKSNTWNGTYYDAFRPYRYSYTPPTERPFKHTIVSGFSLFQQEGVFEPAEEELTDNISINLYQGKDFEGVIIAVERTDNIVTAYELMTGKKLQIFLEGNGFASTVKGQEYYVIGVRLPDENMILVDEPNFYKPLIGEQ